jgi:hypothetical protein
MKPTRLEPLNPNRFLFTRGLGLVLWLRAVAAYAARVAIGVSLLIAMGYLLAQGATGN